MIAKTIMSYNFWDRNDVEGSSEMRWTNNTVENMKPTGRWRVKVKDDSKHIMQIEVVYTQCTRGSVTKTIRKRAKFFRFFKYNEEYDVKETIKDHGRTVWIGESDIRFMTTYTYECTNMGEE